MKKQKIKTVYNNRPIDNLYFAGGYISNYRKSEVILDGDKKSYDTFYLSTGDESFSIMVFHQIKKYDGNILLTFGVGTGLAATALAFARNVSKGHI